MNPDDAAEGHSFTIEYALTRGDIFRFFWPSISNSPKFRNTILFYSMGIGLITPLLRVLSSQPLRERDLIDAILWAIGFFLFIPLWISIRGKPAKRTLTVSPDGISTEIGRMKAQIPWKNVTTVTETTQFILIARTNGNAFFVPNRAFAGPGEKHQFLTAIQERLGRK